jgi:membrane fusion protein, multidrug efflux system
MKNTLLAIALSISVFFSSCTSKQGTDNAQLETDISPVIPKINGVVDRILVEDNQVVKEGDTILVLDDANYRIAVKQAEIAVSIAKQNTKLSLSNRGITSSGVGSVSANMVAAKAGVEAAKIRFELAAKNLERFQTLLQQNSVTQQQFDGIKAESETAEKLVRIAEGEVFALQKQIESSQASVVSSDNGIILSELSAKQAEANLEAAQLQLSYCAITAPSSGVVSKKSVQKGQVVSVGQPLMAITNHTKVWVVANFKETQIKNMKVGQEAEIEVEAYDKTFKGKVESFSQAAGSKFSLLPADNATGNFVKVTQRIPVKVILTESDDKYPLRAGMSVYVNVKTK